MVRFLSATLIASATLVSAFSPVQASQIVIGDNSPTNPSDYVEFDANDSDGDGNHDGGQLERIEEEQERRRQILNMD